MTLPDITGDAARTAEVSRSLPLGAGSKQAPVRAVFGIALHMHQPTVLGAGDPATAPLISNLQSMLDNPGQGDNHNAPVFLRCYGRPADLVGGLVDRGLRPKLMLDYSGNLLWGLAQMGQKEVLAALSRTVEPTLATSIEWLGTMWSHAVASSTPVPDLALHMLAWRHHFAALFGLPALERVRGFSAPEMDLPVHPDACFAFVRALRACGYRWLMVQEHTIEQVDGASLRQPRVPHRLIARNSDGETESIPVLVKTQGSDTKLVGQMQPFGEARALGQVPLGAHPVPPYCLQIGDGENGGVMMNEFPSAYAGAFEQLGVGDVVAMNGSEYLEALFSLGVDERAFPAVQPRSQHRIWAEVASPGPGAADRAISRLRERDPSFKVDRASWTNDRSWLDGYDDVMDPILQLSARFHQRWGGAGGGAPDDPAYRRSLLTLLLSQTSCFRYWGHGVWTDTAREICRRGLVSMEATT
ncbi:MAG TPA: glycosyl hydrolase family 57 [Polyangia bacterium]|nr:glycosyl hydrolase family 57 [Polyangia bacterium]